MKSIDKDINLYLQDDTLEVTRLLSRHDIPLSTNISEKTAMVAVISDFSRKPESLFNAEIICLINFPTDLADVMIRYFNHSVFNFADNRSCVDFVLAYYYAFAYRVPGLDIYDIYSVIGHKTGSDRRITSTNQFPWRELSESQGVVFAAFSNDTLFNESFDAFRFIHQNRDEHLTAMFLGKKSCDHDFSRSLVL